MILLNEREWQKPASIPGLITATADGLVIHAQTVRWFGEAYEIGSSGGDGQPYREGLGGTFVPISWPGEPTRYRVVLTAGGLVLDEHPLSEMPREVPGEVCYLAALTLRSESDTPETVDVEVPRRTCTTEMPADARRVAVPPGLLTPPETPERAAARTKRERMATLRGALAQKPVETMTSAELRTVVALLVEHVGMGL